MRWEHFNNMACAAQGRYYCNGNENVHCTALGEIIMSPSTMWYSAYIYIYIYIWPQGNKKPHKNMCMFSTTGYFWFFSPLILIKSNYKSFYLIDRCHNFQTKFYFAILVWLWGIKQILRDVCFDGYHNEPTYYIQPFALPINMV